MADVLVVAPHPDDEVLGCGGAVANHLDAGRSVFVLYLTSGERGSPTIPAEQFGPVREQEALAAARMLGVPAEQTWFLRLPDGALNARDPGQVGQLIQAFRSLRPGLVYLPHPHDGSFDHQEAFVLCWRAAGMAGSRNFPEHGTAPWWVPTVLGYEVWTPIRYPEYTEEITSVLDRKVAALACYRTQQQTTKGSQQPTYVGEAARLLPGFRGAMTTGGYREAFQVLRLGALPW